jgi:hypothetical protein
VPTSIVGTSCVSLILWGRRPRHHAYGETGKVIGWFNEVIAACLLVCLARYVGKDLNDLKATTIEVKSAPDFKKVSVPYFVTLE